jgi:hypothetical protein
MFQCLMGGMYELYQNRYGNMTTGMKLRICYLTHTSGDGSQKAFAKLSSICHAHRRLLHTAQA